MLINGDWIPLSKFIAHFRCLLPLCYCQSTHSVQLGILKTGFWELSVGQSFAEAITEKSEFISPVLHILYQYANSGELFYT